MRLIKEKSINIDDNYEKNIRDILNERYIECNFDVSYSIIGKGGNGIIVKIDDGKHQYCMKYLYNLSLKGKNNEHLERFKIEIQAMKELKHENILKIEDYNVDKRYYTMPLANKYILEYRRTLTEKLNDCLNLAKAIEYMHSKNIVHRDIKLSNILLYNKNIVLSDFGIARIKEISDITSIGEKIGPANISPSELLMGKRINIDENKGSDVYLFAKIVWQIIKEEKSTFTESYYDYVADKNIYLNLEYINERYIDENIVTIEPLNEMLILATNAKLINRITINECIQYIIKQIAIINGSVIKEMIGKYRMKDAIIQKFYSTDIKSKKFKIDKDIINMLQQYIAKTKIVLMSELNGMLHSEAVNIDQFSYDYDKSICFFKVNRNYDFVGKATFVNITSDFLNISIEFEGSNIFNIEMYKKYNGNIDPAENNKYYLDYGVIMNFELQINE